MTVGNMEQFEYSCRDDASLWLSVHLGYLFMILIPISSAVSFLYPIIWKMWMLWRRCFFGYGQIDEEEELNIEEEFDDTLPCNFTRIFMIEVKLTLIYIIIAVILTYTLNIGPVTQMRITRWIIEAFYAPMSIFIIWHLNFVYRSGEHLYIYDSTSYTQFTSVIKLIIFVLVRYMELYPSSRLNNRPIDLFYGHCNESVQYHIEKNYLLQLSLNDNKSSIL
jgi:hypothetical protein